MRCGISAMRESSTHTRKTSMIWFVGGSALIWSAQAVSQQLRHPFTEKEAALSWFKDTAVEHLVQIRELIAILENHGVHVRTLKARRTGYIVYEDEHQIVAEPFADMNC